MAGNSGAARADKNQAKVESEKLKLQKSVDKFEDQIQSKQRPLIEKALEASGKVNASKNKMGKVEIESAKSTTGILSGYSKKTQVETGRRKQGLMDSVKAPLFAPQDLPRISERMAQLETLFGGV